jgi:hypothetical protein
MNDWNDPNVRRYALYVAIWGVAMLLATVVGVVTGHGGLLINPLELNYPYLINH